MRKFLFGGDINNTDDKANTFFAGYRESVVTSVTSSMVNVQIPIHIIKLYLDKFFFFSLLSLCIRIDMRVHYLFSYTLTCYV